MRLPTSCYRLQFRQGMDFDRAAGLVPYLADLLIRPLPETSRLRLRLQQVTGAAVAKSAKDTAFYREVRLLSADLDAVISPGGTIWPDPADARDCPVRIAFSGGGP